MLHRVFSHSNQSFITVTLIYSLTFCILAVLSTSSLVARAQGLTGTPKLPTSSVKPQKSATPAKTAPTLKASSKPAWQELTPAQQLSLKPLAANWSTLEEAQKRKWIALVANYSALTFVEQAKLHSRMTEWASLSQQQRTQARFNFAKSKQLSPTEKSATWKAYQALSPEEKKKLAVSAPPKPAGAAAAKSSQPKKLASIPLARQIPKQTPNIVTPTQAVDPNTLLPHSVPPQEMVPRKKS